MTRKTRVTVGLSIVAYVVYAVMTGGMVAFIDNDFDGQRDIKLVDGLKSDVWLEPKSSGFGIPFIFGYRSAGKPFGLRLQIWDTSNQYRTIEISEIVLNYKDGVAVRKSDAWSRPLKPYVQHNSSSSGIIKTEMFMLSDVIGGLVQRHVDVSIALKGRLVTATGKYVPFDASEFFPARSEIEVTTGWNILARM